MFSGFQKEYTGCTLTERLSFRKETWTDGQTDRRTDRQAGRQADRQTQTAVVRPAAMIKAVNHHGSSVIRHTPLV